MTAETERQHDLEAARRALHEGELKHAVQHLGGALSVELDHPDHLALLEQLAGQAPENLSALIEPNSEGQVFYGSGAVKAWLLRRAGSATEALGILLAALPVWPGGKISSWILGWLAEPAFLSALDPERVATHVPIDPEGPGGASVATTGLEILRRLAEAHPKAELTGFLWVRALRLAGRMGEAEQAARARLSVHPSRFAHVALATLLRHTDRPEEAIAAFRSADAFAPDDASVQLDIGDLSLSLGRFEDARAAYTEALRREPQNGWAQASLAFTGYRQTRDSRLRERLVGMTRDPDTAERAAFLLIQTDPWIRGVLPVQEASLNTLPRLLELIREKGPMGEVRMGLSAMEAPSALREAQLHLDAAGGAGNQPLKVAVSQIQRPDPRVPVEPRGLFSKRPKVLLWRYSGTDPHPALPPSEVPPAVEALAATDYDLAGWSARARELAPTLPPTPQLLAAMVHVRSLPSGWPSFDWTLRVQLVLALVLAQRDEIASLQELVRGPMDWSGAAAVLALGQRVLERPELDDELTGWLAGFRILQRPDAGHWPLEGPLIAALIRIPSLGEAARLELLEEQHLQHPVPL